MPVYLQRQKKSLPNGVRETVVEGELQPVYVCSIEHQGENK
ncbi:hypothetical protein ART_0741 [Arthrobacter sp. PAMC 25486]|nr:hypothetical protein ART_0741 [Arthrobacter sp. PAMC 25486]